MNHNPLITKIFAERHLAILAQSNAQRYARLVAIYSSRAHNFFQYICGQKLHILFPTNRTKDFLNILFKRG